MFKKTFCIAAVAILILPLQVNANIILDLTVGSTDGESGTINGALFSVNDPDPPSGTGNFNPFLRIQGNGVEQGFNTNAAVQFDSKSGTWTHALSIANAIVVDNGGTLFFEFFLDINEQGGTGQYLSVDEIRIYETDTATPTISNTMSPNFSELGALKYDLDSGMNNTVLLEPRNAGSGKADLRLLVPVWANVNPNKFLTFYSKFGGVGTVGSGNSERDYSASAGFEEWALFGGGTTLSNVPEPSALMMFATVVGLGAAGRRRRGR